MTPLLNHLIIMEHPMMYDRFVLAKVVGQSRLMIDVTYWKHRDRDWSDETKKRQASALVRDLAPDFSTVEDYMLHTISNQLHEWDQELFKLIDDARKSQRENIKKIILK